VPEPVVSFLDDPSLALPEQISVEAVADGRITAVYDRLNPARLGSLDDR
jgi:hypothetical protein